LQKRLPVRFRSTGAYVPAEVITNQHYAGYLDTSDDWIVTRTGIRERRRAAPDECTSTMATIAARRALEQAGMEPPDLQLIVCATATGDCQFPATAAFIQAALGVPGIPAFDVSAACAGFIVATHVAATMMQAGGVQNALVIGAETLTRFADQGDRTTAILFGDAAGAAILDRAQNPDQGILYSTLGCDGTKAKLIWIPSGGSRLPISPMAIAERLHLLKMKGREVYKFAVTKMVELIEDALQATGLAPNDLRMLIPHQSNLRIIESVREKLGLPEEKVAVNIDRYGNTSAASIIMSLDEHRRNGTLRTGDHILLIAIGAGLAWGTMVIRL
jgi:3-oxoacyl-[acyl-carrier-protein] synthase-3